MQEDSKELKWNLWCHYIQQTKADFSTRREAKERFALLF